MSDETKPTPVRISFPGTLEWSTTEIVMCDFAEDWFQDAKIEANRVTDNYILAAAARRREIIFSVCALESYLLEWVRKILLCRYPDLLSHDPNELLRKLDEYFPHEQWSPLTDKWKNVPKKLLENGLIKAKPDLGGQTWQTFTTELYGLYRNSLIHATASRLTTEVTPPPANWKNWKARLAALSPGWSVNIVAALIKDLNANAGTTTPDWVEAHGS